jgi:Xaa-Pro aminopeptidase
MKLKRSSSAKSLHLKRIRSFQKEMGSAQLDMCLVENPIDLFYLTGLNLSAGRLFIGSSHAELFVDGRYLQNALDRSPVPAVMEQEKAIAAFFKKCKGKRIGFDSNYSSYDRFLKLRSLSSKLKAGFELVPSSPLFKRLKVVKDQKEIEKMRTSSALLQRGFQRIKKLLKQGISEKEVARSFEIFCLEQGGEKLSFEPIIAFGANSAMPHHRAGDTRLQKGDLVLIDIGVAVDHYHSDMTRVLFFGSIDPFFSRVYEIVRAAHKAALAACKPGIAVGRLDEKAREVMRAHRMESHFLHSLGHGIGLEVHEFPRIKCDGEDRACILEPGMVITIEPGLYFPGRGGVRYEDTVVITRTGYENLYPEVKKPQLIV